MAVVSSTIPKADDKTKWGDIEETADEGNETTDANGVKTTTEYKTNDKGQQVKVIRKVRVITTVTKRIKRVEERKQWKKFGECTGLGPGCESGITSVGDEVGLVLTLGGAQQLQEQKPPVSLVPANIVCRRCGRTGDHYTLKCPYKQLIERGDDGEQAASPDDNPTPAKLVYVIPKFRGGAGAGADDDMTGRRDEGVTVRVTNLSEDTKESDLQELFRPFGPISRVYLAKDKITNLSRGFAFISFVHREDAAKAIEKLSGFGYDHLILHLEWAKPSK